MTAEQENSSVRMRAKIRPVFPVKKQHGKIVLIAVAFSIFSMSSVFLGAKMIHYGRDLHRLRSEVVNLRSTVDHLRSAKASLTSYASIEERASMMGMVFPGKVPATIRVIVPIGELPLGHHGNGEQEDVMIKNSGSGLANRN